MNKKTKWAIPFAVLALSCGIAAGCSGGHEHSYTEWGYNGRNVPMTTRLTRAVRQTTTLSTALANVAQQSPP